MGFEFLGKPSKWVLMCSLFWWFGERILDFELVLKVGFGSSDCSNELGMWVLPKSLFGGFEEGFKSQNV